jgi:hypothetical protein
MQPEARTLGQPGVDERVFVRVVVVEHQVTPLKGDPLPVDDALTVTLASLIRAAPAVVTAKSRRL